MVKQMATIILVALISTLAGASIALLATSPATMHTSDTQMTEILHASDTDQVLRQLIEGYRLDTEIVLAEPLAGWPEGAKITALELITTQDNVKLVQYAQSLTPPVKRSILIRALCVGARKGLNSIIVYFAEQLGDVKDDIRCQDGELPSAVARSSGHGGAMRRLVARGI